MRPLGFHPVIVEEYVLHLAVKKGLRTMSESKSTARWAMGIAIVSAIMAFGSFLSRPEPNSAGSNQLTEASKMKIHGEGTLNVGYIGTPPL